MGIGRAGVGAARLVPHDGGDLRSGWGGPLTQRPGRTSPRLEPRDGGGCLDLASGPRHRLVATCDVRPLRQPARCLLRCDVRPHYDRVGADPGSRPPCRLSELLAAPPALPGRTGDRHRCPLPLRRRRCDHAVPRRGPRRADPPFGDVDRSFHLGGGDRPPGRRRERAGGHRMAVPRVWAGSLLLPRTHDLLRRLRHGWVLADEHQHRLLPLGGLRSASPQC